MTTVDVYIRKLHGSSSLALRSGPAGAAATALHVLIRAFISEPLSGQWHIGRRDGAWHSTYSDTTVSGRIVRTMLEDVKKTDPAFRGDGDWVSFLAFRGAIRENADYAVTVTEI